MKLSELVARRWVPAHFACLGQRLKPFALGHAMSLEAYGVANPESLPDLVLAVLICTLEPGEFGRRANSRLFAWQVRLMSWSINVQLWLTLKGKGIGAVNELVKGEFERFAKYVRHFSECPEFRVIERSTDGGDGLGAPFIQHVRVYLMEKLGHTAEQVERLTYGDALLDYYTSLEIGGHLTLIDDKAADEADSLAAEANSEEHHRATIEAANRMGGLNA